MIFYDLKNHHQFYLIVPYVHVHWQKSSRQKLFRSLVKQIGSTQNTDLSATPCNASVQAWGAVERSAVGCASKEL